jgi:16S rRNA G966 N2-methylase RsmD
LTKWIGAISHNGFLTAALHALRVIGYRLFLARFDRALDALLQSDIESNIPASQLNLTGPHSAFATDYIPTRGRLFLQIVGNISDDLSRFTFIDLGSGKGRILCVASILGFDKIIGVELSEQLHRVAQKNATCIVEHKRCSSTKIVCLNLDAANFQFPTGNCIIYMYNPFGAEVLNKVLANLRAQLRYMADVYIVYLNPLHRQLLDCDHLFVEVRRPLYSRIFHYLLSSSEVVIYRVVRRR